MTAPRDLLKKVRRVELRTRKLVGTALQGEYLSSFKGQGIEFNEVREYAPGDDVRSIDWNVTARLGRPYIKTYIEERELLVLLCVDISASLRFGTGQALKSDLAVQLAASIAFSAGVNHDRVGLILTTDRIEAYLPPRKGRRHLMRIIRELLFKIPRSEGTALDPALLFCDRVFKRRAAIFFISDFLGPVPDQRLLSRVARRHDVMAVAIEDPAEKTFPPAGLVRLRDQETGRVRLVDASDPVFRRSMAVRAASRRSRLQAQFTRARVDPLFIGTGEDPVRELIRFFRRRKGRGR